jgi:hypothetical protein
MMFSRSRDSWRTGGWKEHGRWFAPACLATALAGCGGSSGGAPTMTVYEVKGRVLLSDGKPLSGGHVYFVAKDGATSSEGQIAPDGSFALATGRSGDGAPPGDYKVRIEPADTSVLAGHRTVRAGKALPFPSKYLDEDTSELVAKVEAKSNQLEPFRLR